MNVSEEQLRFCATKNPEAEYETITFEHEEFEPIRLVANCFSIQTFDGFEYIPVSMKVELPSSGGDPISEIKLSFSRIQIGDELKEKLKHLSPEGWMQPVKLTYKLFSELDRAKPMAEYQLFVSEKGITMNRDTVQVSARDDNEMILNVSTIYTLEDYPSLESL